jgi:hypothetical protein
MTLQLDFVMAGLVPAIHVFSLRRKDVDARDEPGHDDAKAHVPEY